MKIFTKQKDKDKRTILFCGKKIFSYLKEDKNTKFLRYLDKYKYILNSKINKKDYSLTQKDYIWQCWLQGKNNTPPIVKKCMQSVKRLYPDKEVIILDKDNIEIL